MREIPNWDEEPSIAMFGPKRQNLGYWGQFHCPWGDCENVLGSVDLDYEYEMVDHEHNVFDLPPLAIKFFEFFLQKYLKLGIMPGSIQMASPSGPYADFIRSIAIFAHDDVDGRVKSNPSRYPELELDDILDGTELLSRQHPPLLRRRVDYDDAW
ncbi:hypothetical protein PWT90_03779 [Aphanocladium album]|nr:hypothetical protein PWT90_03779 [Aphanocladium album]